MAVKLGARAVVGGTKGGVEILEIVDAAFGVHVA
jgi:hypothetical protein